MLNVGIIGAGLMGQKRAANMKGAKLVAVCDIQAERAAKMAAEWKASSETDWRTLINRNDVDAICICTSHDLLSSCGVAALEAGKHVLVEKPGGRRPEEIQAMIDAAEKSKKTLGVGFNHRFHPAFQKAKEVLKTPGVGPLMYIRARYGHGGRPGYEREWRANPAISGGGELLDQGVHLIDLSRWLGGEFELEWGRTKTFFWQMPVEDNAFIYLESPDHKRSAFLHASWSEWKNLFNFEIFCRDAKLEITGLGRSYGPEELRIYRMKPEMGPPDLEVLSFPGEDTSWQAEFDAFLNEINGQSSDIAKPTDAFQALRIVQRIYELDGASKCSASS